MKEPFLIPCTVNQSDWSLILRIAKIYSQRKNLKILVYKTTWHVVGSLRHELCIQAWNDTSNWQSWDPKVSFTKILSRKCTHWSPVWKTKITTVWQRARHTYLLSTRWRWRSPLSAAPLGGLLVSRPLGNSGDHFLWLYDLLTIFAEKKSAKYEFQGDGLKFRAKEVDAKNQQ